MPAAAGRPENKYVKAKRALRSLAISVAIPTSLTATAIITFGSGRHFPDASRPFWIAPLWLLHMASLCSSFLIGLAAWLVWADGGFRVDSSSSPLYLSHLALRLVWDPVVLRMHAPVVGFAFCAIDFGVVYGCYLDFGRVNPFAKDLVRPCLAWAAYLLAVTSQLMYL